MDDKSILDHINELAVEEHRLRQSHATHTSDDRRRLELIERELDQAWDLLRQRRARSEFGEDPDDARERSVDEVEGYLQ
ncbi:MAG: DUF2630 family protein [Jatrophihabitans sp.]|uniref:DUF2630 family protein n=1 Tax=Jatrophihabitans sp. TaxID=1932789 RepID=UPI003F7CD8CD